MLQKLKFIGIALALAFSFVDARTVFYGATKITVPVGTDVDLKSPLYRVFARDDYDGDITEKITPKTPAVIEATAAEQKISFSVTNSKGETESIEVSVIGSGSTIKIERTVYTLPASQLKNIELSQNRGNGHDRQHLGVYMPVGSSLKIKKISDANLSTNLTLKMYQGQAGQNMEEKFSTDEYTLTNNKTMGGVPFIQTPRTDSDVLPVIEIEFSGTLKELSYYHYKDDMNAFLDGWGSDKAFALIGNRAVQLLVPYIDKAKLTKDEAGGYEPVQNVTTIDALLEIYDEMCEYFNEWSGLSSDETNPLHRLVRTKYFVLPQNSGAGAGYYGGDHCGYSANNLGNYLGKGWILYHELGHGYDGFLGGHTEGKIGEVINNVFGHNYQMTYLDLSKPEDQYYSWTLDYPGWNPWTDKPDANIKGFSWETLNARVMDIRDKNPNKEFSANPNTGPNVMYPNPGGENFRDKLAAVIMIYSAAAVSTNGNANDYGEALAQTYRFIREMKARGADITAPDCVAKGIYNSAKLNVIPVMDLFGWKVTDDMRAEIFQSGDAQIPYNLHYLTSNETAINNTVSSKNLLSKHSLVFPDNSRGVSGNATITISTTDAGWANLNGKKMKIKDGTTVVDEATITSKNTVQFTNIPVGAYSIELPEEGGFVQDYTKSFVIITDGQTVAGQTVNAQTIPYVVGTAPVFKSLTPAKISVEIGKIIALTATVENGFAGNTTWESSDESVAIITSEGVVIGVSTGTVTITATNSGQTKTAEITVIPSLVSAQITRARVNTWATNEGDISANWGNLFDNELSTIWHANWGTGSGGRPNPKAEGFVDLDLGEAKTFLAIEADKRINTNAGAGTIKELRIFIHTETGATFPNGETMSSLTAADVSQTSIDADFTMDGWTEITPALLSGLLTKGVSSGQTVNATFAEPVTARYIRLGITSIIDDGQPDYVQVAEVRVLEEGEAIDLAQIPVISKNLDNSIVKTDEPVILSVEANVTDGGTLSYTWYKDGVKLPETTKQLTVTQPGEYYVVIKNTKGEQTASVTSNKCTVTNGTTPIKPADKSNGKYGIRFAKNIVSSKAEISVILPNNEKPTEAKIVIYDMTGNVVFNSEFGMRNSELKTVWDLRNTAGRAVANGSYLVVVEAKDINGQKYRYSAKLGVKR